jgi:transposase
MGSVTMWCPSQPRYRRGTEGRASIAQIAMDFGVSGLCLQRRLKLADIDEAVGPDVNRTESAQLRELTKPNRLLELKNEVLCRAGLSSP